ncbi:MAG: hypothetical protein LAP85_29745, partial [Acidobacteriia bacterium]|nr:hypothetical protein [Terriglobia bacterium]
GLPEPNRRGVEIQRGQAAGSYAAKWGLEDEITKSHIKRGREGRLTPWDLLRRYRNTGDVRWAQLWVEFASVFKGRHQLQWSRNGLRKRLGLGREKTDAELAQEEISKAVRLGTIRDEVWWMVVRAGARGELLEVARRHGWQGVEVFLNQLTEGRSE